MTVNHMTQTMALLPTMHRFKRTKLSRSTLHVAVSFLLIVYAIIKITIRGTTVSLYKFAAKQPKKELELGVKIFL